ncbi:YeeE/YedE family protein [Pseudemcibacter aquimaris]|uniref:YeeE/YedE family protein n=1 Tax=Pseudemcibacter aquimaris TaxID=2857064 RepID=UPI002012EF28|nr:YeeE/YedE family protein [Pseudemcibacter aquimaris]MCC3859997.1 YeeE/YedE family protein [Pseudemcibacter aquimaris]WDU57328.1 YeeE/YedE family protein [Pseudemcibacter aquimaris]
MSNSNAIGASGNNVGRMASIGFALLLMFAVYNVAGLTNTLLSMVGVMIGLVLVFGHFGFTGGWSAWIYRRDGRGIRAQMLILALAAIIFYPILSSGSLFGSPVRGFVPPIAAGTIIGSFVFGVGMQLGGCCASGALSWTGSGSSRVNMTIIGFIIGGVWASSDSGFWRSLPGVRVNLTNEFGLAGGLGVTLLICALIVLATLHFEKKRHGRILKNETDNSFSSIADVLKGNWPILAVVGGLVLANFLTLSLAGRPWGVSSAFSLWGAKMLSFTGVDLSTWSHWQGREALEQSVFFDITSVMNFGILAGAFIAAQMMGSFNVKWSDLDFKLIAVSIIGGIMLGYGSLIAYGCNIGAFYSGVSSASLSGWIWFASAFMGNIAGTMIKRRLQL